MYTWSSGIWDVNGDGTFDRLLTAAEESQDVLPSFLAASYAVQAASSQQYDPTTEGLGTEEPGDAANLLSKVVTGVAGLIFTVMLPILFGVYTVIIFVSGMTILIGIALLPLAAVLLLVPGGAAVSWFGAWLRMNAGALFVVVFLPVAVSIVVELGIAQPLERTNEAMQESLDNFNEAVTNIEEAFQDLQAAFGQVGPLPGDAQATIERARQAIYTAGEKLQQGVLGVLFGWLFGILTILVGFLVGLFLLFRMERYVMGFLGGLASGISGPSFLGRALVYRGLRAISGEGRQVGQGRGSSTTRRTLPGSDGRKAYAGSGGRRGTSSNPPKFTSMRSSRLPPPRKR